MTFTARTVNAVRKTIATMVLIVAMFYFGATIKWFWPAVGITIFVCIVSGIIFACFYGED